MKKFIAISASVATALGTISCQTTYDAQGRPVQSVDPGMAAVGVVGAGLLGAAIANKNDDRHRYHRYHRGRGHYKHYRHHRGRYR